MPRAAEVRSASGEMEDARTYAIWAAMERSFVLGGEAGSQRLLLPRHSRARFLELVEWMAPRLCEEVVDGSKRHHIGVEHDLPEGLHQ